MRRFPGVSGQARPRSASRRRLDAAGRRPSRTQRPSRSRGSGRATSWSRSGGGAVADRAGGGRGVAGVTAIERGAPLAKLTTIGTGGPARALARPRSIDELVERSATRATKDSTCSRSGSARTCSPRTKASTRSSSGSRASSPRWRWRRRRRAAAGATNAVCLHRARAAGLGGFEFACAIPGTAGGGVFMNAGAYGRDWSEVLVRALVVSADGEDWRTPAQLGLSYRHSALGPGEVVARVEYRLEPRPAGRQGEGRRSRRAPEGHAADEQADLRKRLQEPARRGRGGEDARAVRPQGAPHRRRASSRRSTRTSSRTRAERRPPIASR